MGGGVLGGGKNLHNQLNISFLFYFEKLGWEEGVMDGGILMYFRVGGGGKGCPQA